MRICIAAAIVVATLAPRSGGAEERSSTLKVMVFSDGKDRSGFVGALRIQLAGQAEIVSAGALEVGSVPSRLAAAAARVKESDASLAVWFDHAADGTYQLYAVGGRGDRGLIEVGQSAASDANGDRVLALKVGALVDELFGDQATAAGVLTAPAVVPRAAPIAVEATAEVTVSRPSRLAGFASIGGAGVINLGDPNAQGGLSAGVGARVASSAAGAGGYLDVAIAGHWYSHRELGNAQGQAMLFELGAFVRVAGLASIGPLSLGPRLTAGLRRLETRATTTDGLDGSVVALIPSVELGPAVQMRIAALVSLEVAVGAGLNLVAHTMTIRNEPVVEVKRVRFPAELSLVVVWP